MLTYYTLGITAVQNVHVGGERDVAADECPGALPVGPCGIPTHQQGMPKTKQPKTNLIEETTNLVEDTTNLVEDTANQTTKDTTNAADDDMRKKRIAEIRANGQQPERQTRSANVQRKRRCAVR
eukprot:6213966-Pleurochrysis_carterae.AAC.2